MNISAKIKWEEICKLLSRYKAILIMLTAGIILLTLPSTNARDTASTDAGTGIAHFELSEFETQLEKLLSEISGAGKCRVLLTMESSEKTIVAEDFQQNNGQSEKSTVVIGTGSMEEAVVPLQQEMPEFRGALVVCQGGDRPEVKLTLSAAVSALTGLGSDRIQICKGK